MTDLRKSNNLECVVEEEYRFENNSDKNSGKSIEDIEETPDGQQRKSGVSSTDNKKMPPPAPAEHHQK